MKKSILMIIIMSALILLTACDGNNSANAGKPVGLAESTTVVQQENDVADSWSSRGGAYKQTSENFPDDRNFAFTHGTDIYTISMVSNPPKAPVNEIWKNNTDVIYTLEGGAITCAAASENGIWLTEITRGNSGILERLQLVSFSGEIIRTVSTNDFDKQNNISAILCVSDNVFLRAGDRIIVLDGEGSFVAVHDIPDARSRLFTGNGKAYFSYAEGDSVSIYTVNESGISNLITLEDPTAKVFSGNDENCFIMANSEGMFGLAEDGNETPLIIWADCKLSFQNIFNVFSLRDDEYLCWSTGGLSRLTPADPAELMRKTELLLAAVSSAVGIDVMVAKFNSVNDQYVVTIKDYTEGGVNDTATAVSRLNTEIISGKYPDLILFNDLAPFSYIKKGLLVNLYDYIDADSEIGRDDIAVIDKLEINSGVYYLSNSFNIETLVALYSDFGDRYGWTLDEYLEIEKSLPNGVETLYNTTKEQFLYQISSRYIRNAVDWEKGSADFNNDTFISILEASKRVNENPENENDMNFTYGPVRVAEKSLVAAASWINSVWKLAFEEKMANNKLSFIGWPTVDGSCGSDLYIHDPIGICSQSAYTDGCWEFVKYMMTIRLPENGDRLPSYMPGLKSLVDSAMKEGSQGGVEMSEYDAERFYDLLSEIENVSIYDENILNIIMDDAGEFFSGAKTAANTADIIQSRVSIYLAEQQ